MRKIRTVAELARTIAADPQLELMLKTDPASVLSKVAGAPEDVWIHRIVVLALGAAVVATLVGGVILAASQAELPDAVIAIGAAAVGALAGLLAPRSPGS